MPPPLRGAVLCLSALASFARDNPVAGDLIALASASGSANVTLTSTDGAAVWWALDATAASASLWRRDAGASSATRLRAREADALPAAPWNITLLRRGTYFFLNVGEAFGAWIVHPFGDVDCGEGVVTRDEPASVTVAFVPAAEDVALANVDVRELRWGAVAAGSPGARGVALEHHGRPGSWAEGQVLPGAMLRWQQDGVYYLYVCGSDLGRAGLESGGAVRTGVATSKDLRSWTLAPDPVLDLGAAGAWDESNVFVNGAVLTDDGRVALSYAGNNYGSSAATQIGWGGIGLATGAHPLGPFTKEPEPVLPLGDAGAWDDGAIHEHLLTRLDNGTYLLFYTGCERAARARDFLLRRRDPRQVPGRRHRGRPGRPRDERRPARVGSPPGESRARERGQRQRVGRRSPAPAQSEPRRRLVVLVF